MRGFGFFLHIVYEDNVAGKLKSIALLESVIAQNSALFSALCRGIIIVFSYLLELWNGSYL